MGFFDLNLPYDEHSSSSSSSNRTNRIKIVTKIMELGYSGVAYNRTIKGVMSDQDRCSISLLTLSSLLKILPPLSSSVQFHRDLLGLPRASPFRQYTRLTICLDSPSEVMAVNSGNLILKTYDIVAVKPLNQHAFDQACEKLEIDIITIDFSEKRAFRLKQPMVKSAIQRGVYFEITYSKLISDVNERRQVISTAKLLVDWTRGKNLIFSSAASSVNVIRGPYDVANLSSLLGLSMERAKAAISKNCSTLIANALRKKQFFKETIRVERMPSNEEFDPKEPCSEDLFKYDPISSGEGDLLLDDIAKSFAASSNDSKTVKAIDFTSIIDKMPRQGFLVKDMISGEGSKLSLNNNIDLWHFADIIEPSIAENGVAQQSHLYHQDISLSDRQSSILKKCEVFNPPSDTDRVLRNSEEVQTIAEEIVQPKTSPPEDPIEMDVDNVQAQNLLSSSELNVVMADAILSSPTSIKDATVFWDNNWDEKSSKMPEDVDSPESEQLLKTDRFPGAKKVDFSHSEHVLKSFDISSGAGNVSTDKYLTNLVSENQEKMSLRSDGSSMAEKCSLGERFKAPGDVGVQEDQVWLRSSPMNNVKGDSLISVQQQTSEVLMEDQKRGEDDAKITRSPLYQPMSDVKSTGKSRTKCRRHHRRALLLPLKHLINPVAFKKKVRKTKCCQ